MTGTLLTAPQRKRTPVRRAAASAPGVQPAGRQRPAPPHPSPPLQLPRLQRAQAPLQALCWRRRSQRPEEHERTVRWCCGCLCASVSVWVGGWVGDGLVRVVIAAPIIHLPDRSLGPAPCLPMFHLDLHPAGGRRCRAAAAAPPPRRATQRPWPWGWAWVPSAWWLCTCSSPRSTSCEEGQLPGCFPP